jgi:hypothetical protein
MALVAGVVFFVVRALLALSPALALRHAIKKWAALAALIAAFLYLTAVGRRGRNAASLPRDHHHDILRPPSHPTAAASRGVGAD